MAGWGKFVLTVLVVLMPGGFLVALAYALFRALRSGWQKAQVGSPSRAVSLWAVVAQVDLRDVVRQARLP